MMKKDFTMNDFTGGSVLFSIESAKFWPILATVSNLCTHWCTKKGQNNSKVYQNGQISGMTPIGTT